MTKSRVLGAAAIMAAVIATPAMAQQAFQEPGAYAQAHPWANDYDYGYGPYGRADVIVTAPLSDSYAYLRHPTDDDYYAAYYGDRPVSRLTTCGPWPGATYLGPDGRWHPC